MDKNLVKKFSEVKPGQHFEHGDSKWRKRDDGRAELLGRDGGVSFIGGSRCLIDLGPDVEVRR